MKSAPKWLPGLVLAGAVALFLSPMFAVPLGNASGDSFRDNDWLNCRAFDVMARQAILEHGEFPLRSHLVGGGFPTIAHPSDSSWAPTLPAVLLLGDVLGGKVNLLLLFLAGALGVFGLARAWLGLSVGPSLYAALLFAFSGWAPSMLLVGFYHQVFFLLTPAALYFLLRGKGRPDRLLWAGLLLFIILQQGGHAISTVCYFMGVMLWLGSAEASGQQDGWLKRWAPPLGLLVLSLASLALSKRLLGSPLWAIPAVVPAILLATRFSNRLHRFAGHLRPWTVRLGLVLVVTLSLGAGRVTGLAALQGEAIYPLSSPEFGTLLGDPTEGRKEAWTERFYANAPDLLRGVSGRVPAKSDYGEKFGRHGENLDYEYAFLGLTLPALLPVLAAFALGLARHVALLGIGAALFSLICLGWNAGVNMHFLLAWGVPWAGVVNQPIKYFNFFLLLLLVLLAGAGVERLTRLRPSGWQRHLITAAALALLAFPLVQNRPVLAELFKEVQPTPAAAASFYQVAMVGDPSWVERGEAEIRRRGRAERLREYTRPRAATEYYNLGRGVGTVDWYGTVTLPDHAIPRAYLTPDGQRLDNPRYRGEAWIQTGGGEVLSLKVRPNTIDLRLTLDGPGQVVVNQSWLKGFTASAGALGQHEGLLAVTMPRGGEHTIRLAYRPPLLLAGLGVSALAFILWLVAMAWLFIRRKKRAER